MWKNTAHLFQQFFFGFGKFIITFDVPVTFFPTGIPSQHKNSGIGKLPGFLHQLLRNVILCPHRLIFSKDLIHKTTVHIFYICDINTVNHKLFRFVFLMAGVKLF